MSGYWTQLGERSRNFRVRCDRPEHGNSEQPWVMAQCLMQLYDVQDWGITQEQHDIDFGYTL